MADGIVSFPVISPESLASTLVNVALPDDSVYDHVNVPSSYVYVVAPKQQRPSTNATADISCFILGSFLRVFEKFFLEASAPKL